MPPGPLRSVPTGFVFPPFRLDVRDERLYVGDRHLPLRPKTYAVLRYLIERRGQLVTTNEILEAVWPDVAVSDGVLRVCVREIREALNDDAAAPRFVETAHRRGYRFIAEATGSMPSYADDEGRTGSVPQLVGRSRDLARMQSRLARAIEGDRIVVFVTGEPGIGKTALVEAVIETTARRSEVLVSRGHCVEHYGASEAYLPILEALTQLCSGARGTRVVQTLVRYAPTWVVQMPACAEAAGTLASTPSAGSPARMLREMADAIEALTAESPLLLVLEDVHWSDASTLDLLAYIARRRERARVMIVGTYRPGEASSGAHSLRAVVQELLAHGACEEDPLSLLGPMEVGEYLATRFPGHEVPPDLSLTVHRQTGGNPLFIASLIDYLVERGILATAAGPRARLKLGDEAFELPETVRGVIDRQIDLLHDDERSALEVASVCGSHFTVAETAAAMPMPEATIEASFARLARHQRFLQKATAVELADGAVTAAFSFVHAVHQHAVYERVPLARRTELHRRIGEWLEHRAAGTPGELAPVLAMHFEQGRDYRRAARFYRLAADMAQQRYASGEAIRLATHGIELVEKAWPAGIDRDREELSVRLALGVPLLAARGFGAAEVEENYHRALELSQRAGDTALTFPVRAGLYGYYLIRAELAVAERLSHELLGQARADGSAEMLLHAYWTALVTAVNQGRFADARDHFEHAARLFGREDDRAYLARFGQDAEVSCRAFGAWALWSLGSASRAHQELRAALTRASAAAHPHSLCFAHFFAAFVHHLEREPRPAFEHATATARIGMEHGFPQWAAFGAIIRGWADAANGDAARGLIEIERGLDAYERTGAAISRPHFLALRAEAAAAAGRAGVALGLVGDGLAEARRTGGRYYEAELLRLEAQIRIGRGTAVDQSTARMRLEEAAKIARGQQAAIFEQRALDDLARLPRQR